MWTSFCHCYFFLHHKLKYNEKKFMKSIYIKDKMSILCVCVCLCMWHLYYRVSYSNVVFLSFRFVTLLRVFSFSKGIFNFLRQKNINSLLFLFFSILFYERTAAKKCSNSSVSLPQRFRNPWLLQSVEMKKL